MAINKKLIHFKTFATFNSKKLSADETNKTYTVGVNGSVQNGNPDILYQSICYIKDTKQQWTHGQLYSCNVDPSTLTDVVRVDENGEVNKDKLVVSGEYLNNNYETVSYNYGNQDNTLQFSHLWSTSSNHNLTSVTMKDTIEIASLKSYGGADLYDSPRMDYGGLQVYEGRCELSSVKLSDNGFLTGGILAEEGIVSTQAYDLNVEGYPSKMSGIATAADRVYIASIQYAPTQISTELTVTPEGVFINNSPVITATNIDKAARKMINVTYNELKQLRDSSQLVPGQHYRITDYVTTTSQYKTASAEHQFDVVVLALSENTLSEEAFAVLHEGDEYFSTSNLSAWKLWYCLDNDLARFAWAFPKVIKVDCEEDAANYLYVRYPKCDTSNQYAWAYIFSSEGRDVYDNFEWEIDEYDLIYTTTEEVTLGMTVDMGGLDVTVVDINDCGKGVIYRMIDDYNNDLPYDFKNILFGEIHEEYSANDLGSSISLDNPLDIAYTLLVDVDEEYNSKSDVIVELTTGYHPDTGEETWVLYKTEEGYDEVDYDDMFVFVDKYDYDGQMWDRWRKAEFDGEESYQWVSHMNSGMYILTEELLEVVGQNTTYRYTFNDEEYLTDLGYVDASIHSSYTTLMQCNNNTMKPCVDVVSNIGAQYCLPFNIFKMSEEYCRATNNTFGPFCYNNTFLGACINNIFNGGFTDNICTSVSENNFGVNCGSNVFNLSYSSFGPETYYNTINGGLIFSKGDMYNCVIQGWNINLDSYVYDLHLSGDDVNVKSIKYNTTLIEVPAHEMTLTVAQNSRGEIKIYNEADLIA